MGDSGKTARRMVDPPMAEPAHRRGVRATRVRGHSGLLALPCWTAQWGFWPAALVASALMSVSLMVFGIANNVPWWASLGGGLLLGTMLCWQYWRSGALWLSIGVLSAWNVSNLDLFNLAGNNDNPNLWGAYTALSGPLALQGAAKGVETIISTLVAAAIALTGSWLLLRKRNPQRPWRTPDRRCNRNGPDFCPARCNHATCYASPSLSEAVSVDFSSGVAGSARRLPR